MFIMFGLIWILTWVFAFGWFASVLARPCEVSGSARDERSLGPPSTPSGSARDDRPPDLRRPILHLLQIRPHLTEFVVTVGR